MQWDWTSLISTLFGSGFIVFILTSLYTDFVNTPNINIEIPNTNTINVTNSGLAPAKDLILTVQANGKIDSHQVFNTENFTEKYNDTTRVLHIYIPRLAEGDGSVISINTSIDTESNIPSPAVFATYDEGSVRKPNIPNIYSSYRSLLPIIFSVIGAATSFIILIEHINKKESLRYIAAKIYLDTYKVTNTLEKDPQIRRPFVQETKKPFGLYSIKLWSKQNYEDIKKFINDNDISLIQKFYWKVIAREARVKNSTSSTTEIAKANAELKEAAEGAFYGISWEKYTGFKFVKDYWLYNEDRFKDYKWSEKIGSIKPKKYLTIQIILIFIIVIISVLPILYPF